jgi:hypothetical protein
MSLYYSILNKEMAQQGGDEIDKLLEQESQIAGVSRLLMVTPNDGCEEVRTYTLKIPQPATLRTPSRVCYLN